MFVCVCVRACVYVCVFCAILLVNIFLSGAFYLLVTSFYLLLFIATSMLFFGSTRIERHIKLGQDIQNVKDFVYLGSLVSWNNNCSKDIKRRIGKATAAFEGFRKVWQSKEIRIQTKTRILSVCVMSVLMYAAQTWTLKKRGMNWLQAFKTKCLRRLLNVKNTDIIKRTGTSINIIQRIIERKLNFFGHICRTQDDRLLKQAVFGIMAGKDLKEGGRTT